MSKTKITPNFGLLLMLLLTLTPFSALGQNKLKELSPKDFKWKTGQIIGIAQINEPSAGVSFFFQALTGSFYSHVGVVAIEDGKPLVYESNIVQPLQNSGVMVVPLETFLERSKLKSSGIYLANVAQLKNELSPEKQSELIKALQGMLGSKINYNFNQVYDPNHKVMNCAEFIFEAFSKIGINEIGRIASYGELNLNAFGGKAFEFYNTHYPPLAQGSVDPKTVTPVSVMTSPQLEIIVGNISQKGFASENEILTKWISENGMIYVGLSAVMTGKTFAKIRAGETLKAALPVEPNDLEAAGELTRGMIETFSETASKEPYTDVERFWK